MRNVLKIFISDLRAIFSNFFAVVIMVAVLVIPALYAWVNIYANWDPYANTGNVPIALASADKGYTTEDGEYVNKGREAVEEIAQSTAINWVIFDDVDEAIAAVEAGKYYGALVMSENLSRNMYDLTAALYDDEPSIVFYQNAKTNAIANKITTTASTTAEHNIQVKYLSVLIEGLFEELGGMLEDVDGEKTLEDLIELLEKLNRTFRDYSYSLGNMTLMDEKLPSRLEGIKDVSGSKSAVATSRGNLQNAQARVKSTKSQMLTQAVEIQDAMDRLSCSLREQNAAELIEEGYDRLIQEAAEVQNLIDNMLIPLLDEDTVPPDLLLMGGSLETLSRRMQNISEELEQLQEADVGAEALDTILKGLSQSLVSMEDYVEKNLKPAIESTFNNLDNDISILYLILDSVDATIDDIPPLVTASQSTISALQSTMRQLLTVLNAGVEATDRLLEQLREAQENDALDDIIELLHGDPEELAQFLSSPVEVTTNTVYPVENYGSAMTPFYSTLAIWVGCVVVGAILKTEPDPKKLRRPTEAQMYWGRLLTYLLVSEIQTAIIIAGDIYLLGCQCLEPKLFFMVGAVTSFVFTCLIFSLSLAFGDVGKAIVVVIMVVQIAGSSGSYPIELLPSIFSKIYLFFPFPYAINAMRETLCGLYDYDLYKYLGELMIFGVLGLLVGLVIRRPFVEVNEFIEEEMEETGVL